MVKRIVLYKLGKYSKKKLFRLGLFKMNKSVATDRVFPVEKYTDFDDNTCDQIVVGISTKHIYCMLMNSERRDLKHSKT